ncbi:MAG: T9SS C-terminal target domain-containing protein [Calditrichaeota bacterium]|nr:MAG: T9SS C-terminal target domain-containing protein [Calditrichota bacterium]MBL1205758.1 T9SS C-terminal target domain-containing protein [Calditrichota bacterium]NOG45586.1 T9SS type A sorting domain-containing protein [Calditrichota bacterium]
MFLKTLVLFSFLGSLAFAQLCPRYYHILNKCGYYNEFAVWDDDNSTFTVQVDNDNITSPESCTSCTGPADPYYFVSYASDTDPRAAVSPYIINEGEWHRVVITKNSQTTKVYYKQLSMAQSGGHSPDYVINTDGTGYDKAPSDAVVSWDSILKTSPPSDWYVPDVGSLSGNNYNLFWSHSWEQNVPQTQYEIYRSNSFNGPYTKIATTSTLSYSALPFPNRYYKVKAKLDGKLSQNFSNTVLLPMLSKTSVKTEKETGVIPQEYKLYNNYPNPFNPSTKITFEIPKESDVKITIYDLNGSIVSTLVNRFFTSGKYTLTYNAEGLPSGTYFYKLETNYYSETKKMVLMK